ncbi:aldehyde dehydrogenase family protein [candidate division TA06 bacterium]|uniref:Aldehyde dehydrogenase family protein n=1 Tax=candidate division TA06 bacterium TaxID=2250710 RepID=A0A933ID88_UNCT6|nr:aldehyde dehydrogenase family protein [candidate division TA06 bacterium]
MNAIQKMIIAGRQRDSGKRFKVLDKYTGETIAEVHVAERAQVEEAITAAEGAKQIMADLPAHRRASIIRAAAGIIEQQKNELTVTIAREAGKPCRYAKAEVERCVENLEYISEEAKRIHGETLPIDAGRSGEGRTGYYERFPIGTVAAISPFNFPLNLAAHKLGPAVAAGCPAILKPSSAAPLSGIALVRAFVEAGVPEGGISVLPGTGPEVGDPLVSDGRISKVSFTGSKAVGEQIVRAAGLKRVTMELGSNSGVVIDREVGDIGRIAKRCVLGAFYNQGQVCISIQRIYVHADRYDDFVASFSAQASKLKIGNPTDPATEIGPMIAQAELERVRSWVDEAIGQGARLLFGNRSDGPVYYPTALTDVTPDMKVVKEEVFGPVAVVVKVDSFEQGVELCDQSQYGLQAGVFTDNINRALRAVRRINAGGVMINDFPSYRVDHMPYGGNKASGLGREGAKFAIEEMTTLRMVVFNQTL